MNHHIVGGRQHNGTTEWFTDGDKCREWKATGSLLWIHGKRMFPLVLALVILSTKYLSGLREERLMVCCSSNLPYWELIFYVAPRSSTMLQRCAKPDWRPWHIFTLTFETSTTNPAASFCHHSSSNFLLVPMPFATYSPISTRHTTTAHIGLTTRL